MSNWSSGRRRSPNRSGPRPQWLAIIATLVTAINAIVRMFGLFKKKGGSTTTSRSNEPASVPSRAPTSKPGKLPRPGGGAAVDDGPEPVGSDGGIGKLFKNKQSDVIVQASGTIVKILPDETDTSDGSGMHQKFLVELMPAGPREDPITIKIAHNFKFGRVPAKEGDTVSFKGEYEWTEYGGTVHWTHHDPRGVHADGFIELDGKRYE
jgi:hypothetical protein